MFFKRIQIYSFKYSKKENFSKRVKSVMGINAKLMKIMKIMQNEWTKWKLMELVKIDENNLMELMKN